MFGELETAFPDTGQSVPKIILAPVPMELPLNQLDAIAIWIAHEEAVGAGNGDGGVTSDGLNNGNFGSLG